MQMSCSLFENTGFGKSDLVWNVPGNLGYFFNYGSYHNKKDVQIDIKNPMQLDSLVIKRDDNSYKEYDYLQIFSNFNQYVPACYFITAIRYDTGIMILSLTLDVITTFRVLQNPVSGTIVRRHVPASQDSRFGYTAALNVDPNYTNEIYDVVGYGENNTKLVESTVNLKTVAPAKTLTTTDGESMVIPVLPEPEHVTTYEIMDYNAAYTLDNTNAFTLYLYDELDKTVFNTVRGLSGDGAISDSYMVPSEAITVESVGSEVTNVRGRFLTKSSNLQLEIPFSLFGSWTPRNKAVEGMFKVAITSMQEKTRIEFPAWDLQNSVDEGNYIRLNLWCDPKPSGAPYCCPDQVETIQPLHTTGVIKLATMEVKSVKGGQWLRNPLIYSTGKGEIFATAETQLQREKADYDKMVAMHQLNMSQKEREIRIAQSDYQYESGLASGIIGSGMSLLSKDFSGAFGQAKTAFDSTVNQKYIEQLRALQDYEHKMEKTLISMAYTNNLKNLNVQESIRRVVPREVVYGRNESMGSFSQYNSFTVSIVVPDIETLKSKDLEYTLYGYPVYQTVENFYLSNTSLYRNTHTVFQFLNPTTKLTGVIGAMVKETLQAGIRLIHRPFTPDNILNN